MSRFDNTGEIMSNTQTYRARPSMLILLMLACIGLLFLGVGCKSSTKPEPTGTLSGTVNLETDSKDARKSRTDNSGVTVAVYRLAIMDSTLVRLNSEHPNVGVIIDQETEFDHRNMVPVSSTTTNADGAFSITGLATGVYNVVFLKEGWSVLYLYNVSITAGSDHSLGTKTLSPALYLSGFVNSNYTFLSDRTYILTATTSFTSPVILQRGARMYIARGESIRFLSTVSISENVGINAYWKMDTAHNLYTTSGAAVDSTNYFASVAMFYEGSTLSRGTIRRVSDGVSINAPGCIISHVDIMNFSSGLTLNNTGGQFTNLNVRKGTNMGIQALSLEGALTVNRSIVKGVATGIIPYSGGGFTIEDNYLLENDIAIYPQNCTGAIRYNNFWGNNQDVKQYIATCEITYNNFYYSKYISLFPRRVATINNNNFYKADYYFISIRGGGTHNSIVGSDLYATDNYWAVSNVDNYILDALDNANYPGAECTFFVRYLPRKPSRVLTAGIR